jgi:hypothetical protein
MPFASTSVAAGMESVESPGRLVAISRPPAPKKLIYRNSGK